ncbi:MAG: pyruvate ferredoxin oxidoreductase [Thermodesulfobacteriota bacterium]
MRKVITGNVAVSYGAMLSDVQVVAAYPITPQTTIIEELATMQAEGLADFNYIRVESEHSAMAACIGASMGGARAFTATCGQGLFLMHEMLHYAAGARTPIVLANVNRAAAAPWSIWSDQTDSVSQRETGWIQLYCEGNQEVLDTTIMGFKIAEQLRLPTMVVLDAFFLSHTSEPVDIPEKDQVRDFLPPFDPGDLWLDPDNPRTFGGITMTDAYMEFRWQIQRDMEKAKGVITDVHEEFAQLFGRQYRQVDAYQAQDAGLVLVVSGTAASTARDAIDYLRKKGENVGMVKLKTLRPFPREELMNALRGKEKVAIIDRNFSPGATGVWAQEVRSALYELPEKDRPLIYGYIAGLGGRDISVKVIEEIYRQTLESDKPDDVDIWIGVNYV